MGPEIQLVKLIFQLEHDKINKNEVCAKRRLGSTQSDHNLRSPTEERLGLPINRTAKTLIRHGLG